MNRLHILWSSDRSECETCGPSWDEGAVVTLDNKLIYDEPAAASCMSSQRTKEDHWEGILRTLGYAIDEDYEEPEDYD